MAEPEEEELGQGVHGAVCTSALLVRDCKGRALAATRQGSLTFVGVQQAGAPAGGGAGGGGSGGATATLWLLAAAGPGCYTLQSADSGHFLAAADGQIVLSAESQAKMQLFMDLDRRACPARLN